MEDEDDEDFDSKVALEESLPPLGGSKEDRLVPNEERMLRDICVVWAVTVVVASLLPMLLAGDEGSDDGGENAERPARQKMVLRCDVFGEGSD